MALYMVQEGHGLGDNMRGASPSPCGKGVELGAWTMMMYDGVG